MKRLLFPLICIFPQLLLAQTLTSGHSLRAGDELRRSVVYVPDCPYEGEDAVWNLEDMVFLDNSLTSSFCGLESAPGMVTCYDLDSSASLRAVLASTMGVVYRSAEQTH